MFFFAKSRSSALHPAATVKKEIPQKKSAAGGDRTRDVLLYTAWVFGGVLAYFLLQLCEASPLFITMRLTLCTIILLYTRTLQLLSAAPA